MALPLLESLAPRRARAQDAAQRFIAFFYPNGTDPSRWNPSPGALTPETLSECLQDLNGFAAEGDYPAGDAIYQDVTVVTGIDHSGVSTDIHMPSMSLSAHAGIANNYTPPEPTLDQFLADRIQGDTPYRNLAFAATGSTDIGQGNISFRAGGQVESVIRDPRQAFQTLFGNLDTDDDASAVEAARLRQQSVLDYMREDAERLQLRLGAADRQRIDQYFQAVFELEQQVSAVAPDGCTVPEEPGQGADWHGKAKAFADLTALAMACDLTRVVTLQYSDSWGVHYGNYPMGSGLVALGDWSDHFLSHKLDDTDRATDLDSLERGEAQQIADERVVLTSRFKARRYAHLVNALKSIETPTGNLLDETLVMYISENGDGDSHARTNMPILLAGHVGGFETGRVVATNGAPTGALHHSILRQYGIELSGYGDDDSPPLEGL
jgi:hypothetical protein